MEQRTVKVVLDGDVSRLNRAFLQGVAGARAFTRELDTSSDRAANLTQSVLAIGPALVPITASAIPVVAGLTNQLALAAGGAGAVAIALNGVGEAVKAVDDFRLDPTAESLEKMQQTFDKLGPAGRDFAVYVDSIRPKLQELQDTAQAEMLPGFMVGIDELLSIAPQFDSVVASLSSSVGMLAAEAGTNLADPRWAEFFDFLEVESKTTLVDFGRTLGNLTEGFAQLWMAFDPISDNFSDSFLRMSRDFRDWATELDQTEGFQDFVEYLDRVGPKAWDTLGSLGNALLALAEAAAPVGEASLPIISAIADTLALVMESDAGPVLLAAAAGVSALSRSIMLYNAAQGSAFATLLGGSAFGRVGKAAKDLPAASRAFLDFGSALDKAGPATGRYATTSQRLGASLRGLAGTGAAVAGLGLVMSDLDDQLGVSNTAMLALAATAVGPWGTALGAAAGAALDLRASTSSLSDGITAVEDAIDGGNFEQYQAALAELDQQIARTSEGGGNFGQMLADWNDGSKFGKALTGWGLDALTTSTQEAAAARAELVDKGRAVERAAQDQAFAEAGLQDSMMGASDAAREQTAALLESVEAMNAKRDAALESLDAELAYEAALDDAAKAARENPQGLDVDTAEGRANLEQLSNLAARWNDLSAEKQNAAGASERARRAFIRTAEQMGATAQEARDMADEYLNVPTSINTRVRLLGAPQATSAARRVREALLQIPNLKTTTIRTIEETFVVPKKPQPAAPKNTGELLLGGPLLKRRAMGGIVRGPGTATSDSIPALLSDGEYVVNAFSTARHLPLLQSINAQKFADGGQVSASQMRAAPATRYGVAAGRPATQLHVIEAHLDGDMVRIVAEEVASDVVDAELALGDQLDGMGI